MRKSEPAEETSARLFLVKAPQPEPPAEMVEEALNFSANFHIADFAFNISLARTMLRNYRALVEAPDFPEFLRKHYVEMYECEPDDENVEAEVDVVACTAANAITPEVRRQLLPKARETAQYWLINKVAG